MRLASDRRETRRPRVKQAVDDVRPEARLLREIGQWDVFPTGVTNGTASIGSSNGKRPIISNRRSLATGGGVRLSVIRGQPILSDPRSVNCKAVVGFQSL